MTKIFAGSCLLLAALLTLPTLPARAQDEDQEARQEAGQPATQARPKAAPSAGDKVSLDFKDIELADLIQTVSELTGKNFLYDDTVKGKATIISPAPMSLDEAYKLFLTVLNVKGYTVVPSGKVFKVVPLSTAKESNLPLATESRGYAGDDFVTRLIPLSHIDATVLATTVLAPLVPKTSHVVAYAPSNTLIITDSAANIDRLLKIIRELDIASGLETLEVISLKYASADEIAQVATQVLSQVVASPRRGRSAAIPQAGGAQLSKVLPFARTNALVVMATLEDMETVRRLVADLDTRPSQERSNINVYYLENADAETLAKTLNEILTGIKAQTQGRTAGRPAQAAAVPNPAAPLSNEPVSITADKPTNSLIINATPEDLTTIKGIISQLDIKRKQVFVEALILELSMNATQSLGAALQGAIGIGDDSAVFGLSNQPENSGIGSVSSGNILSTAVQGILLGGFFNIIDITLPDGTTRKVPALSALIDLSKTDTDVNILSAPRLLTSDNEEAEIIVGQNVPIITQRLTGATGTDNLSQSVSVERKDVALTLRFTPQVTEGNLVRLNVYQEITNLVEDQAPEITTSIGPTFTKRLVRNTVLAESGRTVVLGGLIGTSQSNGVTKVPLLGDIPGLGWLFKRSSVTERKTNLLIFITPKIIRDAQDLANVTRSSHEQMSRAIRPQAEESKPVEVMAAEMLTIDPPMELGQPQAPFLLPAPMPLLPQDAQ
ncbi:MAG: type II secretion system secretin GspD [Trichloromonadaceae bacterium]